MGNLRWPIAGLVERFEAAAQPFEPLAPVLPHRPPSVACREFRIELAHADLLQEMVAS
jgi:hypothetical protein